MFKRGAKSSLISHRSSSKFPPCSLCLHSSLTLELMWTHLSDKWRFGTACRLDWEHVMFETKLWRRCSSGHLSRWFKLFWLPSVSVLQLSPENPTLLPLHLKKTPNRPFSQVSIFFLLPVLFFLFVVCIFLPFSHHQLKTISHPSAGQINSVPDSSRKAQRVQLASISRQGGKDDRERCWNESSVWAHTWFSLGYKSKHYGGCLYRISAAWEEIVNIREHIVFH